MYVHSMRGAPKRTISTGQPQHAQTVSQGRTHKAPTGFYAPMPSPIKGTVDRVLQGGFPPVPWRHRNACGGAYAKAREPFACAQIRGELAGAKRERD